MCVCVCVCVCCRCLCLLAPLAPLAALPMKEEQTNISQVPKKERAKPPKRQRVVVVLFILLFSCFVFLALSAGPGS